MKNTTANNKTMIIAIAAIILAIVFGATTVKAEATTDMNEAAGEVLENLEAYNSNFSISFTADSKDGNGIAKEIFENAIQSSDMVDFMEYGVYNNYSINWTAKSNGNGEYDFTFNYKVSYKTTKAQAARFEKKLDKVMNRLNLDGKSDKAKVKKIYNWITKNVKYDKKSNSNIKYTAYAALNKKKAVCQGYSVLFYRMCEEAGVDAKVVTGQSRGENHAWNIVKVGKTYRNVDATWDAGKSANNYKYFLKGMKNFKNHTRNSEYSADTFYNAYPMARK